MKSEQIDQLAIALAKAQSEIEGARESADNPYFKSKYADLHQVWKSCRNQLTSNGLSVCQTYEWDSEKDRNILVTTLLHSSGQWMQGRMALPQVKPGAQELGSCTTYCRRYALSALVGMSTHDDDGEDAQKEFRQEKPKQPIKTEIRKTTLLKAICATGTLVGIDEVEGFLGYMCEKYSRPEAPYTQDDFIEQALESPDKIKSFSSKLKEWLYTKK